MRKLIALDLDGTLLQSDMTISTATKKLLKELQAAGHLVTIATGRPFVSAVGFVRELEITNPFLAINGALMVNSNGKIYKTHPVPKNLAREFLDFCLEKDITCTLVTKDEMFISRNDIYAIQMHQLYDKTTPTLIENRETATEAPILNIFLNSSDHARFEEIFKTIHDAFEPRLRVVRVGDLMMDVVQPGVSKGEGLKDLAAMLNIPMSDTIAIGDNHNDIQMLKMAGTGVAMAGADREVQQAADMVTAGNDEDGVIRALEKLIQ
ncbi:MAG: HAD family hydrolase [Firmicutes bacterium]|nr:HAD family hydrolase [Bacillota bacterium]